MKIQIGRRNQPPDLKCDISSIPQAYQDHVGAALELYRKQSTNPYQSRTYTICRGGISATIHIQGRESRRTGVC